MNELLSNTMAGQMLAECLPERSADQWQTWLQNNRNQARPAFYRVPFVRMGGGTFYAPDELEKYVAFEQSRRVGKVKLSSRAAEALRAFGIGEPGGTSLGRTFKGGTANPHPDNKGGVIVQTTINEPLTVFAMTPEQAIEFGKELIEAGQAAQRINGTQNTPAAPSFATTTITDNADALIQRREYKK